MIDIEKLKALERAATPGAWGVWSEEGSDGHGVEKYSVCHSTVLTDDGWIDVHAEKEHACVLETHGTSDEQSLANARLIGALRNALPELLTQLEEARRLVSMLRCDMECVPDDAADHTGHWPDCATVQARIFLARFGIEERSA